MFAYDLTKKFPLSLSKSSREIIISTLLPTILLPSLLFIFSLCPLPAEADDTLSQTVQKAEQDTRGQTVKRPEKTETIRKLRKQLAERESIIEKLENEKLSRPVHPTVKRLRETIGALQKTVDNLESELKKKEKQLKSYKKKNSRMSKKARMRAKKRQKKLNKLQKELQSVKNTKTTRENGEMTVILDDKIFFDLGKASLKSSAKPSLKDLSNIISDYDNYRVLVQGHTDTVPLSNDNFGSNWELSAERAVRVVEYIQENSSISGDRLVAAGYGSFHPIVPNTSDINRAKNRRVEIKLVPMKALKPAETVDSDTTSK
ncbi:MAG: flagellar motor protein MotB [bacterium]